MRILLAEDDTLLGDGLRAGLRQQGLQVDWVRDGTAHTVLQAGRAEPLSTREFELLQAPMLNAGRVMSREQLEQHLYS